MILVDTSVWIDHLRSGDEALKALLNAGEILSHPWVIGELALGRLAQREVILSSLRGLPRATVATDYEVLEFIDRNSLVGLGVGYVDVHLLAATRLSASATLWTRDRRLLDVAQNLGLAARIA